jgi:dipeptide/tripeptide permease
MKLIDNWQTSWKFYSSMAAILVGFLNGAVAANFFGWFDSVTPQQLAGINAVAVGLLIPILRAIKQFAESQAEEAERKEPQA